MYITWKGEKIYSREEYDQPNNNKQGIYYEIW